MTEKLFYINPYISDAECTVTDIISDGKTFKLVLDKTPFFPEGGGQSCDKGTIDGEEVVSVTEKDGVVYHELKSSVLFEKGKTVLCHADSKKRFSRMQAHSGEHIVSGLAHTLFGAENTGFHMDDTVMTVDFNLPLTDNQLKKIEEKANEAVWKNLPVTTHIYTPEEAKTVSYRSKKDFDTDIRIVTIEGTDSCACCAPHVTRTGEIGLILITGKCSHRGGVRITLICGETAAAVAAKSYAQVKTIAEKLVVAKEEAVEGLDDYIKKADDARLEKNLLSQRICRMVAESVTINGGNTVFVCSLTPDEMTKTGAMLLEKTDAPVILISGCDDKGYNYTITAKNKPLRAAAKTINAALNGRGGGNDEMIRGTFAADIKTIKEYFGEKEL